MDKIKLRLCAGTMCYVMGGAQLMEIEELLSEEEKQGIEITFSPCLQRCNGKDTPPFNVAHQDPNLPVDLEIRRNVVKKIKYLLETEKS